VIGGSPSGCRRCSQCLILLKCGWTARLASTGEVVGRHFGALLVDNLERELLCCFLEAVEGLGLNLTQLFQRSVTLKVALQSVPFAPPCRDAS
jgi:hypothetical protein